MPRARGEALVTLGPDRLIRLRREGCVVGHHAPGAGCPALEAVVPGRAAMGERVRDIRFRDHREIRREGAPFWIDPLAPDASALEGAATLNAARALPSTARPPWASGWTSLPARRCASHRGRPARCDWCRCPVRASSMASTGR